MKYKSTSIVVGIFALFLIVFMNTGFTSAVMVPVNISGNTLDTQIWLDAYINGTDGKVYILNGTNSYSQNISNASIETLIKKYISNLNCVNVTGVNGTNITNCYINVTNINNYVLNYSNNSMANLTTYLSNFFYTKSEADAMYVTLLNFQNHVNENVNSINGLSALSGRITVLDDQMIALNQSDILYKSETSNVGLWIVAILALVVGIIAIYLNLAGGGGGY